MTTMAAWTRQSLCTNEAGCDDLSVVLSVPSPVVMVSCMISTETIIFSSFFSPQFVASQVVGMYVVEYAEMFADGSGSGYPTALDVMYP